MGAIKIGRASRVADRINNIQVGTPHEVVLLAVIDGAHEIERQLHREFSHARIRGEWFRPVPELMARIEEIKNAGK